MAEREQQNLVEHGFPKQKKLIIHTMLEIRLAACNFFSKP